MIYRFNLTNKSHTEYSKTLFYLAFSGVVIVFSSAVASQIIETNVITHHILSTLVFVGIAFFLIPYGIIYLGDSKLPSISGELEVDGTELTFRYKDGNMTRMNLLGNNNFLIVDYQGFKNEKTASKGFDNCIAIKVGQLETVKFYIFLNSVKDKMDLMTCLEIFYANNIRVYEFVFNSSKRAFLLSTDLSDDFIDNIEQKYSINFRNPGWIVIQ